MRVNIYAEEMTGRVEIISKEIDGVVYTGLRFYFGFPFIHREDDDDSSAVTFWRKKNDLNILLESALLLLEKHHSEGMKDG